MSADTSPNQRGLWSGTIGMAPAGTYRGLIRPTTTETTMSATRTPNTTADAHTGNGRRAEAISLGALVTILLFTNLLFFTMALPHAH
jgi:hypothetical protein